MRIGTAVVGRGPAARRMAEGLRRSGAYEVLSLLEGCPAGDGSELTERRWRSVLSRPDVDFVALCLPPADLLEPASAVLAANKAVLLDGLVPASLTEFDALSARQSADTPLGVMLPLRMLLDAGQWPVGSSPVTCGSLELSRFVPEASHDDPLWASTGRSWQEGAVVALLAPYLDLACQLLGEPVAIRLDGVERGTAAGSARFTSGAQLSIAVTINSVNPVQRLEVLDAERRFTLDGGTLRISDRSTTRTRKTPTMSELHMAVYHEMADALLAGRQPEKSAFALSRGLATAMTLLNPST
ncbi:hypothetical protein ACFC1R_22650 [Kitasatospora sp. NPDC056138]|uniref:hypothetical protein n=1 Tax=Kitasatospora sp. NPDC056138 TaxID=3345724 RepID=UPI0035D8E5D7